MNARNEPSALQIVLDEVRALRNDFRIETSAIRTDMSENRKTVDTKIQDAMDRADEAHERIDRYENRMWGWVLGAGSGGALTGATFSNVIKDALRALFP